MVMMHSGLRALQKRLEKNNPILYNENAMKEERFLSLLKGKPFWIEDKDKHKEEDSKYGDLCCWNHIVGLPKRVMKEERRKQSLIMRWISLKLLDGDGDKEESKKRKKYFWIKKVQVLELVSSFLDI